MEITSQNIHDILKLSSKLNIHIDRFYRGSENEKKTILSGFLKTFELLTKLFFDIYGFSPSTSPGTNHIDIFVLIATTEYQINLLCQITGSYTSEDYEYLKTKLFTLIKLGHHMTHFKQNVAITQPRGRPRKGQIWDKMNGTWVADNKKDVTTSTSKKRKQIEQTIDKAELDADEADIVKWLIFN